MGERPGTRTFAHFVQILKVVRVNGFVLTMEQWNCFNDEVLCASWHEQQRNVFSSETHMCAAYPFQEETGHFCLPVKLSLGHPELMFCLQSKRVGCHWRGEMGSHKPGNQMWIPRPLNLALGLLPN